MMEKDERRKLRPGTENVVKYNKQPTSTITEDRRAPDTAWSNGGSVHMMPEDKRTVGSNNPICQKRLYT